MSTTLRNPQAVKKWKPQSNRQMDYLKSRKTDRKKNAHPEQEMQDAAADWLRQEFPTLNFYSDTGSGAFNSSYAKDQHNRQQSNKGLPDMNIFAARREFHGLCLELKPDGTRLKMVRDSKVTKVYKNSKGKIIHRDLKPRLAGDWKDYQIERQHQRHLELRAEGYCATFVIGLEQFKKFVCWYMGVEYQPPVENAELLLF